MKHVPHLPRHPQLHPKLLRERATVYRARPSLLSHFHPPLSPQLSLRGFIDIVSATPPLSGGVLRIPGDRNTRMAALEPPSSTAHNAGPQYANKAPPISVAVNPVALVISECVTVTSAMRKNARWAQSSVSAILGGGGAGYGSSGIETPVPGSPSPMLARRGDLEGEVGLTGRWGLRGKKGRSIQVQERSP